MLSPERLSTLQHDWFEQRSPNDAIDIEKLLAIVRRQWAVVALATIVAVIIGVSYALTAVPLYTATSSLLIDRGNDGLVNRLTQNDSVTGGDDEVSILSQVEVLKSDTIGLAVVDKLNLGQDPLFMASSGSFLSKFNPMKWFVTSNIDKDLAEKSRRDALTLLQDDMDITRVGRTYILNISFTSPSADLSARVANAIPDAYILDKLDSKYDSTRRASDWLLARIDELKQRHWTATTLSKNSAPKMGCSLPEGP